jgi:2-dehydro-3-deoxygluconokinase
MGSVGSTLGPDDVDPDVFSNAGTVVAGGIACAISASSRAAVIKAAALAKRFVFDPNFRPRLTGATEASAVLAELAPQSFLVTPSYPGETSALLDCDSPQAAAQKLRGLGGENVAVTCGADGIQLDGPAGSSWIDSIPAPSVVDQTGAGDAFVGTLAARMMLGDSLSMATRYGAAAASLVVGGKGGTGFIPTFDQTQAHARTAPRGELSSHA